MLHDAVDDPGLHTEAELLAAHVARLREAVEASGVEVAADAAGLDPETISAVADGDAAAAAALDLEAVAAILALDDGAPGADAIAAEARDALLFGMTAGVLNVDVVAGDVSADLEPREVQGMLEGRHPMTLRDYAALQHAIAARST